MRKNYKLQLAYDLRENFGDYSNEGLESYFNFNSNQKSFVDAKSITSIVGAADVANSNGSVVAAEDSPYQGRRFTSLMADGIENYYRIYQPFQISTSRAVTISGWFLLPNRKVGETVLWSKVKAGESFSSNDGGEIALSYSHAQGRFIVYWRGTTAITAQTVDYPIGSAYSTESQWVHVAVTIVATDSRSGGFISQFIGIWVNGKNKVATSRSTGGDVGGTGISASWVPKDRDGDIVIGRGGDDNGVEYNFAKKYSIYDFAIWNRVLESKEIQQIYRTSKYHQSSGILSDPVRVQIQDERPNAPTTVARPTIPKPNTDSDANTFYDTTTRIFYPIEPTPFGSFLGLNNNQSILLRYPLGLPENMDKDIGGIVNSPLASSSISTPNEFPTITAFGSGTMLGDYVSVETRGQHRDQIAQGEVLYSSFNDTNSIPASTSSFYIESHPGFEGHLQDKIQIVLELPMNQTAEVGRHSAYWSDASLAAGNPHYDGNTGEYYNKNLSGFLYYNKTLGQWEQKGLNDPVTGVALPDIATVQHTKAQFLKNHPEGFRVSGSAQFNSGAFNHMRMFYPGGTFKSSSQYPNAADYIRARDNGDTGRQQSEAFAASDKIDTVLKKSIGFPMASCGAPNAIQYFATSSQTIKMSDYITEPFLLEKVILEIPNTIAKQTYVGGCKMFHPYALPQGQRDYVFFLMRQSRQFPGDTTLSSNLHLEASSSIRYIICSGSACFYNDEVPAARGTFTDTHNANYREVTYEVKNSPAFKHNWGAILDATAGSARIGDAAVQLSRTGSISLPMIPASAARKVLGNFFVPIQDGNTQLYITQSIWNRTQIDAERGLYPGTIQAFWPGGTTTQPFTGPLTGSRSDNFTAGLHLADGLDRSSKYFYLNGTAGYSDESTIPYGTGLRSSENRRRTFFEVNPDQFTLEETLSARKNDPRTFKPWGAGGSSKALLMDDDADSKKHRVTASFADDFENLNSTSPYLLMPEDELILGVDAAFGPSATLAAGITEDAVGVDNFYTCGANGITGSILSLVAGKPMKLRFFGSRVKNQVKAPDYPLYNTTQDTITETIIGSNIVDQYAVNLITESSGSYLERLVTGSILKPGGAPNLDGLKNSEKHFPAVVATRVGRNRPRLGSPGGFNVGAVKNIAGLFSNELNYKTIAGGSGRNAGFPSPDPRVTGPAANRLVLTCSVPTQITGFAFSKFYIRFWSSNDVGPAGYPNTAIAGGSIDASTTPASRAIRSDEIYIGVHPLYSSDSFFKAQKIYPKIRENLLRAFNGTSGIGSEQRVYFGSGITGGAASHNCPDGIPGVTASGFEYDGDSTSGQFVSPLKFTIDKKHGAVGNRAFIVEGIRNKTSGITHWAQLFQDPTADDGKPLTGSYRSLINKTFGTTIATGYEYSSVFFPTSSYLGYEQNEFILGPTASFDGGRTSNVSFRQVGATSNRRNLGDHGSFQRFISPIDFTETYWDSLVPNISEVWGRLGSPVGTFYVTASTNTTPHTIRSQFDFVGISIGRKMFEPTTLNTTDYEGALDLEPHYNPHWWASFPFEPKLNRPPTGTGAHLTDLGRVPMSEATNNGGTQLKVGYLIAGDSFPGIGAPAYTSGAFGLDLRDAGGVYNIFIKNPNYRGILASSLFVSRQQGFPLTMENIRPGERPSFDYQNEVTVKNFYGVGGSNSHLNLIRNTGESHLYPVNSTYVWPLPPQGGSSEGVSPGGAADENGNYTIWSQLTRRSEKPRGWKYGLYNVMPTHSKASFRGDHYGQFRDMLEQRSFAVYGGQPTEENFSVKVQFVEPTWLTKDGRTSLLEDPYESQSQNVSPFATSSLPFFDTGNSPAGSTFPEYPHGRDRLLEPPLEDYVVETSTPE